MFGKIKYFPLQYIPFEEGSTRMRLNLTIEKILGLVSTIYMYPLFYEFQLQALTYKNPGI
jgi:hypothetical protein